MAVLMRHDRATPRTVREYEAYLKELASAARSSAGFVDGHFLKFPGYGNRYSLVVRFADAGSRQAFVRHPVYREAYGARKHLLAEAPVVEYWDELEDLP